MLPGFLLLGSLEVLPVQVIKDLWLMWGQVDRAE
jgi:hypothetical protein